MKYQNHASSCGAAALANALRFYGHTVTEEEVQELAVTTGEGTGPKGLRKAIKKLGYRAVEISSVEDIWLPTILCVDDRKHWVAVCRTYVGYLVVDAAAGVGLQQRDLVEGVPVDRIISRAGPKSYGISVGRRT